MRTPIQPDEQAIVSRTQADRRARLPWGEESAIRLSSEETGAALSIFDYLAPAGWGVPRHVHHREDEILRVVSGQAVVWTPQFSGRFEAGDLVKLPKGVEHAWRSYGIEPIRFIVDVVPGGFEMFFPATEGANLREDDIPGRSRIAAQFGIELTGGPLSDSDVEEILRGQHPSVAEKGFQESTTFNGRHVSNMG